jgi:MFS family permease
MVAMSYGAAFGAIQQLPQIAPGVPEVVEQTQGKPPAEVRQIQQRNAALLTSSQEWGGLLGRVLLAILAIRIVSRQKLLRLFQLPGLIAFPLVFGIAATTNWNWLFAGAFVCGMLTVGQFSFWGNYLPRVYPVHLRGTGESFAANVGGRMIGTFAGLVTTRLVEHMPGGTVPIRLAYACAVVGTTVYVIGIAASFFMPEPKPES